MLFFYNTLGFCHNTPQPHTTPLKRLDLNFDKTISVCHPERNETKSKYLINSEKNVSLSFFYLLNKDMGYFKEKYSSNQNLHNIFLLSINLLFKHYQFNAFNSVKNAWKNSSFRVACFFIKLSCIIV